MINIEIKSAETRYVNGVSKASGKPFQFYKQDAYAHLKDEPYPVRVEISHDKAEQAYQPGMYHILPESLYVDRFNSLTLGRLKLAPVAAKAKPAAA